MISQTSDFMTLVLSLATHRLNRKVKNNKLCSWNNIFVFFFDLLCLGLICLFCFVYIVLLDFTNSWHVIEFWKYRSHWMKFWNTSGRIAIFNCKDVEVKLIFSLLPPEWIHKHLYIHICMFIDVWSNISVYYIHV